MGKKEVRLRELSLLMPATAGAVLLLVLAGWLLTGMRGRPGASVLAALTAAALFLLALFERRSVRKTRDRILAEREAEVCGKRMEHAVLLAQRARKHEERVYRLHHDIKNHLGVVYSMLEDGRNKEAELYLEKLRSELEERENGRG